MVEYGMSEIETLKSVTSVNARFMNLDNQIGTLRAGLIADIISVMGNPIKNISVLREVQLIIKDGQQINN